MKRVILFDFSSDVLHPEKSLRVWVTSIDSSADVRHVKVSGGSILFGCTTHVIQKLVKALDDDCGPEYLLWALVPTSDGDVRRVRGKGYNKYMSRLLNSCGRTARLNALPHELKEKYRLLMTHPDFARED